VSTFKDIVPDPEDERVRNVEEGLREVEDRGKKIDEQLKRDDEIYQQPVPERDKPAA